MNVFRYIILLLACLAFPLQAADTLLIKPLDEAFIDHFGDMITLSRQEGVLQRYVNGKVRNVFSGKSFSSKLILQDPLRPFPDGPDKIYILDTAARTVITWDRFLNVHSVTPLHPDIVSPAEFIVTSEHDWLIYDRFGEQIIQIRPGQHFLQRWGDQPVSGDIRMFNVNRHVFLYLPDDHGLRICDDNGTTLEEHILPDSLDVRRIFPLDTRRIGLASDKGIYLWEPNQQICRFLSPLKDVVFLHAHDPSFTLINRRGVVITIP